MTAPALAARKIEKRFGATVALACADLTASAGEVHALLGENGAGKSTLLGIIAGILSPDAGALELDGRPYAPGSAADAKRSGVAIVPQEPTLCLDLTVAENIVLGHEPTRLGLVDEKASARTAEAALDRLGLRLDVGAPARALSPAERQLVNIARALAQGSPRVVVIDEPTSSLPHAEAERVLRAVKDLAGSNVCVLYVSHHLEEIIRIADRYTVLRDGRTVEAAPMQGATIADLTRLLLGRQATAEPRPARERGALILEVRELHGKKLPRGASLDLHRGEVLGVAGLVGSGRTELLRAIFALDAIKRGTVRVAIGEAAGASSPADRIRQGLGMTSEDRKSEGVVGAMSVADNLTLSRLDTVSSLGLVSERHQEAAAAALIERLSVRTAGAFAITSTLSGGNQQKVAIGRLIHQDADVLLLDEPTRGIDLKSREQIYDIVDDLVRRGKGVLWVSSQLGELLRVCDRIAVMKKGVLSPAVPASTLTEHSLLEEISAG